MNETTIYQDFYAANKKEGLYSGLLFFVWPLLALVSAFKNYKKSWAKNIFWAFCAFYGLSYAIGSESQGSDIVRYIAEYQNLHNTEVSFAYAWDYYTSSNRVDFLKTAIALILSRFTDHPAVLTLVYGTIFGFFYSRNFWFILERLKGKVLPLTILLLTCFLLINPIWNLNGFRMWTAAHIFIYGLLPFLFDGNKKKIWISVGSIFVHFSFIVPVAVILAYIFIGNRVNLYFIFFIVSAFFVEIDIEVFNDIIESYFPVDLQESTAGYRAEENVEEFREGTGGSKPWYAMWYGTVFGWAIIGYIILIFIKRKQYFQEKTGWMNLYSFTLLFYGVSNLLSTIPSGGRFITVANLCAVGLIILSIQNLNKDKWMKRYSFLITPALLLFIVVAVRIGFYSLSAASILGNPLITLSIMGENLSMNDFIRMIL